MPRYWFNHYKLDKSELLLMSDVSATSFDARYFGPMEMEQVRGCDSAGDHDHRTEWLRQVLPSQPNQMRRHNLLRCYKSQQRSGLGI